jgi:hypothetical protein
VEGNGTILGFGRTSRLVAAPFASKLLLELNVEPCIKISFRLFVSDGNLWEKNLIHNVLEKAIRLEGCLVRVDQAAEIKLARRTLVTRSF